MELKIVAASKAREVSLENQKKNIDKIRENVQTKIEECIGMGATGVEYQINMFYDTKMLLDFITGLEELGYKVELINEHHTKTLIIKW